MCDSVKVKLGSLLNVTVTECCEEMDFERGFVRVKDSERCAVSVSVWDVDLGAVFDSDDVHMAENVAVCVGVHDEVIDSVELIDVVDDIDGDRVSLGS